MSTEQSAAGPVMEVQTVDGGMVTLARGALMHLHYQGDEELRVFGLAVGCDFRHDRNYAHILEHLVMRQQVDGQDLSRALELNSSTQWSSAFTTSRCISFEVSGYTERCAQRSASLLCRALFEMQVTEESYRIEADETNGRLTTEEQAQEGIARLGLLVDIANRAHGTDFSVQSAVPRMKDIQSWHSRKVHPDQVLWFTSGPETFAEAHRMVATLRATCASAPKVQADHSQPPVAGLSRGGGKRAYPGTVLAWQGPSPLHQLPEYAVLKTLHTAALRHPILSDALTPLLGSAMFPQTSTVFSDLESSFVTLGLKQEVVRSQDRITQVADKLREAALCSHDAARQVLDNWLVRKLKYYPGRRPKGSRVFAEVREGVLAGGDLYHLVKPEALAREVSARIDAGLGNKLLEDVYQGEAICL
jgi:hypothetical protein